MKAKKIVALLAGASLCVSMLAGCGSEPASNSSEASDSTQESSAQESGSGEAEDSEESEEEPRQTGSTDPMEMIHQGYYSWTYPVDGMDDMCAFFHFYEEQPVLGAVFYAGFAWNPITYAGTYTVEQTDCPYNVCFTREDQMADPAVYTEGTAPYTVTFFDFQGNELGKCGYDGEFLYNDSPVDGTGGGPAKYAHDTDAASKYASTYEAELGIAYLDFVAAEEKTSTLTLYHNGRYMDMVNMMVEGTWSMAEAAEGYEYTLTPDSSSDTGAVVAVAADEATATYTPEGGEAVAMVSTVSAGPKAAMEMKGTTPIPGQEVEAEVVGQLFDDGNVKVTASAFGSVFDLDEGTWTMGEDGYTITFQFKNAGELVSGLGEAGAVLQYKVTSEIMGEVDTELVISIVESGEPKAALQLKGEIPVTEEANADVVGDMYDDGTVKLVASAFGQEMELDAGTWVMGEDGFTVTFTFDNAGEIVSAVGESGAAIQYKATHEVLGEVDTELVISPVE